MKTTVLALSRFRLGALFRRRCTGRGAGGRHLRRLLRRRLQDLPHCVVREEDRGQGRAQAGQFLAVRGCDPRDRRQVGLRRGLHRQLARRAAQEREAARDHRQEQAHERRRSVAARTRQGRPVRRVHDRCDRHRLRHQADQDTAHLLVRPCKARVRRQARHRRHQRHLGLAVPDGAQPHEGRHAREHGRGVHGHQADREIVGHALHAGRPDRVALRTPGDRRRRVVPRSRRLGHRQGPAAGHRLSEGRRGGHPACAGDPEGREVACAGAQVHRRGCCPRKARPASQNASTRVRSTRRSSSATRPRRSFPTRRLSTTSGCPTPRPVAKSLPDWTKRWQREVAR